MSKALYPRLAATNIRKHGRLYLPYLISSSVTVAMFYILLATADNDGITQLRGAVFLSQSLFLGCGVIAIFSLIFLVYTNSFIVRQRTSEFGLYNVLGMEKRHISKVMFFETLYSFLISVFGGIITGIVFNKLILMLLCRLISFDTKVGFTISIFSIIVTFALFAGIFLVCLIINIIRVKKANAVNLLKSKNVGEREPKTKWILTVLGVLFLGAGYTIAIVVKSPLKALLLFFVAVLCVIFGTYLLFMTGSIAVLKALRKNKNYYYNSKHFNSVSGMLYRMKRNAAGLANICILSTMVLVMVSTTVSLYAGEEQSLNMLYPKDICVTRLYGELSEDAEKPLLDSISQTADDCGLSINGLEHYTYLSTVSLFSDGVFTEDEANYTMQNVHELCFITADDYNRITGEKLTLSGNETAVYSSEGELPDEFSFIKKSFVIVTRLESFPQISDFVTHAVTVDFIVVADMDVIEATYKQQAESLIYPHLDIRFDIDGTDEQKIAFADKLEKASGQALEAAGLNNSFTVASRQLSRQEVYAMYGSFLFLGITLGSLFLMVTVMIIYYKQVSEGYDDKERFEIMQKVGMSRDEVKKTIGSQVLTVFFLPLITAFIHIAFAFPIITRILAILNLTNVSVFVIGMLSTALIFTVIYTLVYLITSRTYYKIVQ